MDSEKEAKCGDCAKALGTTAKATVYCQLRQLQMLRDSVKPCFVCSTCGAGK